MPKIELTVSFKRGAIVYLKTDPLQSPHIVTNYDIGDSILYGIRSASYPTSYHCRSELTTKPKLENYPVVKGFGK